MADNKRNDGRYRRSFRYEGKRYYVYGRTKVEAAEKEIQKLAELQAGTAERDNPTLNQYYKIFTEQRRRSVRESTIRSQTCQYKTAAGIEIDGNQKKLGELKIREITPKDILNVQYSLAESNRKTETVNNIMAHLKHVFNAAVKDETIERSPCVCLSNLKRTEKPARETIHRALSVEETREFFDKAKERDSFYYNLYSFLILTGMRVGEAGALLPFDIDERAGYIHVRRTVTRDLSGNYTLGDGAKTMSGVRDIPLSSPVREIIRNQKRLISLKFIDNPPKALFPSIEGAILRDYMADREIKRICKDAGIERFTCHAFRATYATRFIEQRPEDYKILSEVLGHSDVKITLNLYTHVMDEKKKEAVNSVIIGIG